MRIAIMGAGGLGGYFGARLCTGQADVHFIARGRHLAAMRADGLRIEGPEPLHIPQVNATDDPAEVGVVDVVMINVKLWDTEAVLEQIRPMVGPETAIVSFQNGVLKDRYLRAAYDASQIMGGVGYIAATIDRPGVIRQTGTMQRLVFGEFDGSRSARGQSLLAACEASGINADLSTNINREIWQKFVFLAAFAGLTTTTGKPIGAIREHPRTRALLLDLMREIVTVGRAYGADLPADYADERLRLIDGLPGETSSSMHHDFQNGRPLEVRWLSGGVVELGKVKEVSTPLNRAIADILALHESGANA